MTTFSGTGLLFDLPFTVLFPAKTKAPLHPISASISFPESALPVSSGWQLCGKWNSKFALKSFLKSTDLLKLFDTVWKSRTCSSGYAWGSCTYPGAHYPQRATSMRSCIGVFTISLYLERFWHEIWISFKFHKPISKTYRPKIDIFCLLITFSFLFNWYLILRMRS